MEEIDLLKKRLEREKRARKEAERILEAKALELYQANESLKRLNESLEDQISERTAELQESETKFRNVIDQASDIIYSTDAEGYFTFINPLGINAFGYSKEEIIGKRYIDFVTDDYKEKLFDYYTKIRDHGAINDYNEFPIRSKDGETFWIGQNVNRIEKADGGFYYNAVARDITERKELENSLKVANQKAVKAQKAEQQFLANMSHEIRTPLNAIIGMSHLLRDTNIDARQKEYVEILSDSAGLLKGLVSDILDISKIDSGTVEMNETVFELTNFAERLINTFENRAKEKGISLISSVTCDVQCIVKADAQWLNQILINLLSNAIKFTPEGAVELIIQKAKKRATSNLYYFEVRDTGIGISEKEINHIFSSFKQANTSVRKEYGGTGLGLSIASRLVSLLGGELEVESNIEKGSRFFFSLNLKPSDELPIQAAKIEDFALNNKTELSILVVEDNIMNQKYISSLLEKWKVDYLIAENGQQAIEKCRTHHFDMIFMDLSMPVMDGYTATDLIRQMPGYEIPIIALTASTFLSKKELAMDAGMNDFLAKPFTPEELYLMIQKHMSTAIDNDDHQKKLPNNRINRASLNELYGDDHSYALDMFRTYIEVIDTEIKLLKSNTSNKKATKKQAHKISPMFAMVGLMKLSQQCKELESKMDTLSHTEAVQHIESIITEVHDTKPIIKKEIKRLETIINTVI